MTHSCFASNPGDGTHPVYEVQDENGVIIGSYVNYMDMLMWFRSSGHESFKMVDGERSMWIGLDDDDDNGEEPEVEG